MAIKLNPKGAKASMNDQEGTVEDLNRALKPDPKNGEGYFAGEWLRAAAAAEYLLREFCISLSIRLMGEPYCKYSLTIFMI